MLAQNKGMTISFSIENAFDDKRWDDFILNHPYGNIFQSHNMYEVYRNTKNYYPIKIFAINQATDELNGVLNAVVVCEVGGFLSNFSAHSIIQGGPIILPGLEKEIVPLLVTEHDRLSRRKALYSEIRNLNDFKDTLRSITDYKYEDHLNFLLNLDQSETDLWHQLHQSRKKNIKRAAKENVIVEEMLEREFLNVFYKLLQETYMEVRIPLAHISLFEAAFDILYPAKMIKFFLARQGNKYIGARAILLYKNIIYDWYAGAAKDALEAHPNDYLVWHILKWGIDNGYKQFDFGGAGKPDVEYGPREFKRRFGGELVNYGRHINVYSPKKMEIVKRGFEVYRKLIPRT